MAHPPSTDEQEAPSSDGPLSGRIVGGRWRVLQLIGRGGMGSVYEAQNVSIGKRVALKFVDCGPDNTEAVARFQREAEAASAVESAHIVHVFDTGTTDEGQPYLVMELLRGESLGSRLRRQHRLSIAEAANIVAQMLRGLSRAHGAGVIHRDLKPDNIFLTRQDDDTLCVKILDFGISKITRTSADVGPGTITRKGVVLGTPYYMSPEQAQAHPDLDARSDLFSVGAILFECLAGHAPWSALTSYEAVIVAICSRDAPDVRLFAPEAPASLADVIKQALARDRAGRHASATAFLDALRVAVPDLLSGRDMASSAPSFPALTSAGPPTSTTWTPSEPLPSVPPSATRSRALGPRPVLLGVGVALLAFAGTLAAMRSDHVAPVTAPVPLPPPQVTLRLEVVPADAAVLVDGQPLSDGLLRGTALSEHEIHASAPGYEPQTIRARLNGRPTLRIELAPSAAASASASASASTSTAAAPSARASSNRPPLASPPSSPSSASKGLQLKERLK